MSHFSVLVIGEDVEEQLAPYSETDEEYMDFVDNTDEYKEEYETETTKRMKSPEGKIVDRDAEMFKTKDEKGLTKYVFPDGYVEADVPFKEVYATFEDYCKEYHGATEQEGRFGYMSNDNAKWDWYSVGGRWAGFFKLKQGATGELGEKSWGMEGVKLDEKKQADVLHKGDVDFAAMVKEASDAAGAAWDAVHEATKDTPPARSWKEVLEASEKVGEPIEKTREIYHEQERVKAFGTTEQGKGWAPDLESFMCSREEYVNRHGKAAIAPWAIVYDGEWTEKGEMGWWGMSSNEMTQDDWNAKVIELLMGLPDDTLLTLVDCHI